MKVSCNLPEETILWQICTLKFVVRQASFFLWPTPLLLLHPDLLTTLLYPLYPCLPLLQCKCHCCLKGRCQKCYRYRYPFVCKEKNWAKTVYFELKCRFAVFLKDNNFTKGGEGTPPYLQLLGTKTNSAKRFLQKFLTSSK